MLKPTPRRVRRALSNPRLFRAWGHHFVGKILHTLYASIALSVLSRWPVGENVYDDEWDLLIVLDACRVDAIRAVAPEYDFIDRIDTRLSLGSITSEWLSQTFTHEYAEEIAETVYVSANPWTERIFTDGVRPEDLSKLPLVWTSWDTVDASQFEHLEPAWTYESTGEFGIPGGRTPPRYVTDRAIELGRERDAERYVVHYIQPHAPYTARAFAEGRPLEEKEADFALYLRQGHEKADVWPCYLDELRFVLDSVRLLLENFDADTAVITADHGEAFGEYGIVEHPTAVPLPQLRRVPWIEASATDGGDYQPVTDSVDESGRVDVESRLTDLGYR